MADNKRDKEIVVVIPVREGSSRVKDKNFKPFGGHETFIHNKIAQLKDEGCFDHIYVSSDSEKVKEITKEAGGEFLYRDPLMCTSTPRWDDVVVSILDTVPGDPHVAWAMVTSPLFTRYNEAVSDYFKGLDEGFDSLLGVKDVNEYLMDDKGRPLFYGFGPWHPYTNEFKPMYAISDVVFIAPMELQKKFRYWFGRKPNLFKCNSIESIDVNFEDDLSLAYAAERIISEK